MTQTMLERAARAAFEIRPWGDVGPDESPHTWENLPEAWREVYDVMARAVLMAVRDFGMDIYHSTEGSSVPDYCSCEEFDAMIDAIINEPQP